MEVLFVMGVVGWALASACWEAIGPTVKRVIRYLWKL